MQTIIPTRITHPESLGGRNRTEKGRSSVTLEDRKSLVRPSKQTDQKKKKKTNQKDEDLLGSVKDFLSVIKSLSDTRYHLYVVIQNFKCHRPPNCISLGNQSDFNPRN